MVNSPLGESLDRACPGGIGVDDVVGQRAMQKGNGVEGVVEIFLEVEVGVDETGGEIWVML